MYQVIYTLSCVGTQAVNFDTKHEARQLVCTLHGNPVIEHITTNF